MSERSNSSRVVVLLHVIFLSSIAIAAPEEWVIQQISTGAMVSPWDLAVDGDQVAYIDGAQVMLWAVGQPLRRISSGQNDCSGVRMSDGTAAWYENIDNAQQVMVWDGQLVRQVSSGPNERDWIRLSGGTVAWKENIGWNWQYMLWNGQATRQITSGTNHDHDYRLWEGKLAWNEWINGQGQILLWDGQTIRQISSGQNSCGNYDLSDGQLAWLESISGKDQVMFWDGLIIRQVSDGLNPCRGLQLSGGIVGWMEEIQGKFQAMLWDGQTARHLSDGRHSGYGDMLVSGRNAAWQEGVGGSRQIFFWDGQATAQITANMKSREVVQLTGDLVAWNEFGAFAVPRSHIYCYQDHKLTPLARVETSNLGDLWSSRSILAWIGVDSMDDAQVFVAMKGQNPAVKEPAGDVNRDLKVDLQDLAIVSAHWLVDCGQTPENPACKP